MKQNPDILAPIEAELERFNKIFDMTLQDNDEQLSQILNVVSQRKGKLMRPILLLLVAKEFGEINDSTYLSAVTLEMLHTASLIHDDVVDESNERRGRASLNAIFGNKVAVLAGDYLLSNSLLRASDTLNLAIVNRILLLGKELAGGEIMQLKNSEADGFSETSYFNVIKLKTAALFAASAELGSVSVGADKNAIENAKKLGEIIGMCFQIRDDIFDYYDDIKVGKPTGNDLAEGKLTLPILYVIKNFPNPGILDLATQVKDGTISKEGIDEMVHFAKDFGGIEYAKNRMQEFADQAKCIVNSFSNDGIRKALIAYIEFVTNRSL